MLRRRDFLTTTLTAVVGGALSAFNKTHLERIGLGLFTIPKFLDQDFAGAMKMLAQIGYKEIEFFGPYPFSVPSAHERWKAISASLGVRQSGYFGLTAQQMKKVLDRNNLTSPSMHVDMNTLRTRMSETAEAAHAIGQRYVCLPSIPAEERKNLDAYKRVADEFNEIGARAEKAGLRFAYHNHGYGLAEMEGQIPFQVLLERTDARLVDLQMDIYWTTAGGADPIALQKTYPGRFRLIHIKDMTKRVRFAGDGGDAEQWMALFPFIADAGSGVLDLPGILAQARKSDVQHFLVERDLAPNPVETLKKSYQYLAALEFE